MGGFPVKLQTETEIPSGCENTFVPISIFAVIELLFKIINLLQKLSVLHLNISQGEIKLLQTTILHV